MVSPSYTLCDQVVTLYHGDMAAGFRCTRTVFRGAYWGSQTVTQHSKGGITEQSRYLLILPSGVDGRPQWVPLHRWKEQPGTFTLCAGDKVLRGEGPVISTGDEWRSVISANYDDLLIVKDVKPLYLNGAVTHVEVSA